MHIKVLGCSGGIISGAQTTSFLLGETNLIDAGSGVFNLSLQAQQKIERVFITHSHFDHVVGLPFLIENASQYRHRNNMPPIRVYANQATINDIQTHLFNDHMWPDFTKLPNDQQPTLHLSVLEVGEQVVVSEKLSVEAISAVHNVPTQGYSVHHKTDTWIYTSDTTHNPLLWQYINQLPTRGKRLRWLVTETTFGNADQALADKSQHNTVNALVDDINTHLLQSGIELYVMHLKPSAHDVILQELDSLRAAMESKNGTLHVMQQGQVFSSHALRVNHAALHVA